MKILPRAATLLAALAVSATVHAAPPTEASIEELMRVTRVERLMETMNASMELLMRQTLEKMVEGERLTPQQRLTIDSVPKTFSATMREELSWPNLRSLYVQVYQETFTQEEIDGLIAFYRSPAGAAFVEKMPAAMNRSMILMQGRLAPILEKMKASVAQSIAEAKAKTNK